MATDWVDEIEAQADDSVPYYQPRLIAEIRTLRSSLALTRQQHAEQLQEKDREIERLTLSRDRSRSTNDTLEAQLAALREERDGWQRSSGEYHRLMDEASIRANALEREAERLRADLSHARAAQQEAEALRDHFMRDATLAMKNRADGFQARAEQAEAALAQARQEIARRATARWEQYKADGYIELGDAVTLFAQELSAALSSAPAEKETTNG